MTSESVFDDDPTPDQEATKQIDAILAKVSELPKEEPAFVEAVQDIGLLFRGLSFDVMNASPAAVQGWINKLRNVPEQIGVHPEYSNASQKIIDGIRNGIADRLNNEWMEEAGTFLLDDDSGIDLSLSDDSGVELG